MTDQKLHELLDQTQFGDVLTLAHSNGKHTASISGPVLTDQTHDPAVGIHLLDGHDTARNADTILKDAPMPQPRRDEAIAPRPPRPGWALIEKRRETLARLGVTEQAKEDR